MLNSDNFTRCQATFANAWKSHFNELEVCVFGAEVSPSEAAISLAQQVVSQLGTAKTKALRLLELFVRLDGQWSFDGIEVSPASFTDRTVDLQFSHIDDLYGLWVVTFNLQNESPEPIAFRREQT